MKKKRNVKHAGKYFNEFYSSQISQVRDKITWIIDLLECLERIPENYLKHLTGTDGLYEMRIQLGGNTYRILCFFYQNDLVTCNGFQKKTEKTPQKEIDRATKIKKDYYEKIRINNPR